MTLFLWTCPFCNRNATIMDTNFQRIKEIFIKANVHGKKAVFIDFTVCPNPECGEFTMTATLYDTTLTRSGIFIPNEHKMEKRWDLIPPSTAKSFPDYIPKAILEDYEEACLIKNLSPKASATLARRCLQGMIRNFWGVKKKRLFDEIEAIKDEVEKKTWEAIDAVREVGNIGAHMQEDINLIIDIDPKEAALLIELIEILIEDWYVNRHEREEKLKAIKKLGEQKKPQKRMKK